MAAVVSDSAARVDALKRQNSELIDKIAQIKLRLGIQEAETEEEKKRIRAFFDSVDKSKSGLIDPAGFELLAFECGAVLSEDILRQEFASINGSHSGLISFEE